MIYRSRVRSGPGAVRRGDGLELGDCEVRSGADEADDVAPVAALLGGIREDFNDEDGVDQGDLEWSTPQTPLRPAGITVGHGWALEGGWRKAATSAAWGSLRAEVPPATISPASGSGTARMSRFGRSLGGRRHGGPAVDRRPTGRPARLADRGRCPQDGERDAGSAPGSGHLGCPGGLAAEPAA
jgi:hypothetical protein